MDEYALRIKNLFSQFLGHLSYTLPLDVKTRLEEMERNEKSELGKSLYRAMRENQDKARSLLSPSCQDTGIVQFHIRCGALFPYINSVTEALTESVREATSSVPLRPNAVETFDEYNTGDNTGHGAPAFFWDIIPGSDEMEVYTYLSGGGCSLPGKAEVMMPLSGYGGIVDFVVDQVARYAQNACPPVFVGVGIGATSESAALNAKKALMRPVGSSNENRKAAELERLLFKELNGIGIGVQGLGGEESVLGVNIVNTVRHPATLAAAVSFGCWSFRRGRVILKSDLSFSSPTHPIFEEEHNGRA